MRYFEDIRRGECRKLGPRLVDLDGMVDFADRFDRQPVHTDPVAAVSSVHGGLIASGLHTLATCTALLVDGYLGGMAMVAGLGVDRIRFLRPVRPGDALTVEVQVDCLAPHHRREEMGVITFDITVRNQAGAAVMTCSLDYGVARRPALICKEIHA